MAWQLGSFLQFFASSWQTACQNYFLLVYNDVFVDGFSNRILDEQVAQESLFRYIRYIKLHHRKCV